MSLPTLYQDFIHLSRYSRWLENEKRRETWEETVERYFKFFRNHLKQNQNFDLSEQLEKELKNISKIMDEYKNELTNIEFNKKLDNL